MSHITRDALFATVMQRLDQIFNSPEPKAEEVERRAQVEKNIDLLITQYFLNIEAAGPRWIERATAAGKAFDAKRGIMPLDYQAAAFNEAASELFASACPYEWWRDPSRHKLDFKNARMEMVDVMHFLLSETMMWELVANAEHTPALMTTFEQFVDTAIFPLHSVADCVLTSALSMERSREMVKPHTGTDDSTAHQAMLEIRAAVMKLCSHLVHSRYQAAWAALAEVNNVLSFVEGTANADAMLTSLYHGKVALNSFRWSHGMKEGTYRKVWAQGKEDNDYLQTMLTAMVSQGISPTRAHITEWLEVNYAHHLNLLAQEEAQSNPAV